MWRKALRSRHLLPGALVLMVTFGGFLALASSASANTTGNATSATATTSSAGATSTTLPSAGTPTTTSATPTTTSATPGSRSTATATLSCQGEVDKISITPAANSGSPNNSTTVLCEGKRVAAYGNPNVIRYVAPNPSVIKTGEALFEQNCSSCRLADAQGGPNAPSLVGVGPATVEFWVNTGRMPATIPRSTQAPQKPPRLTRPEAAKIASFINSLSPRAPYIPQVTLNHATVARGASLFALNCAACHTITGAGDALAYSTFAPGLHAATPTIIASAIRTGPGNMPPFAANLTDSQVRDIVAYVSEYIQHPSSPGGFGLGGVGPVAEGFVALLFGLGGLMLVCYWIGERA